MLRHQLYAFLFISLSIIIGTIMPIPVLSLSEKDLETHIHVHLRMVRDGRDIIIPAYIGLDPRLTANPFFDRYSTSPFVSALHTHYADGIIHIESAIFRRFTLADFLNVWGMDQTKIAYVNTSGGKQIDYKTQPLQSNNNLTIVLKPEKSLVGFTHYIDSTNGLAFDYPSDWNINKSSSQTPLRVIYTLDLVPKEASFLHAPFLIPNLSIEIARLPVSSNITLDQYTIAELSQVLQAKKESMRIIPIIDLPKVIDPPHSYNFNGNPARQLNFTTDMVPVSAGYPNVTQHTTEILSLHKNKAYIVSYSGIVSPSATSYLYDNYLQTAEKIIRSIKLN
jgi:hypothetical protein